MRTLSSSFVQMSLASPPSLAFLRMPFTHSKATIRPGCARLQHAGVAAPGSGLNVQCLEGSTTVFGY
jgi:hypothetical protein